MLQRSYPVSSFTSMDSLDLVEPNKIYKQKAREHFSDTIAEFLGALTGQELFDCFVQAAQQNVKYTAGQYDYARDLMDCIKPETQND